MENYNDSMDFWSSTAGGDKASVSLVGYGEEVWLNMPLKLTVKFDRTTNQ